MSAIDRRLPTVPNHIWGAIVTANGVGLTAVHIVHLTREELSIALLIGVLVPLIISVLVILPLGLVLLANSMGVETPRYRAIRDLGPWLAGWMVFGIVWMTVAGTGTILYETAENATLSHESYLLAIFATYGSLPGLITGYYYGRTVEEMKTAADREKQLAVFSRILRHNFRNSMNVLLGETEQVLEKGGPSVAPHAEQILDSGNRLMTTVENERFLVETVVDPSEPVEHRLHAVVDGAIQTVRADHPDAEIETHFESLGRVNAHPQIERALVELLDNAVEYDESEPMRVDVRAHEGEDETMLIITDSGPGIPMVETDTLRDDVAVESLHHGSGLGLRIADRLVDQSNGSLQFSSGSEEGTTVRITLPAAKTS